MVVMATLYHLAFAAIFCSTFDFAVIIILLGLPMLQVLPTQVRDSQPVNFEPCFQHKHW